MNPTLPVRTAQPASSKERSRDRYPTVLLMAYRFVRQRHLLSRFMSNRDIQLSRAKRIPLLARCYRVTCTMECGHADPDVLPMLTAILSAPASGPGVVVEAGCYKGGSTAKFSLAAAAAGRQLVVFDSFAGIPDNDEVNERNIHGGTNVLFRPGDYCGPLDEVKRNIRTFGKLDVCRFVKGWFEETLPSFHEPIIAAFVDVDLASSTRTCLKYLYPLLVPGGTIYSHDGHLPLVIDVLRDERFWLEEVGFPKPPMEGLGTHKVVKIVKPLETIRTTG
jgi:O-methyltransferase